MNRIIKFISGFAISFAIAIPIAFACSLAKQDEMSQTFAAYSDVDAESYYDTGVTISGTTKNISRTKSGSAEATTSLLYDVHELMGFSHRFYNSYTNLTTMTAITDADPDIPGNIILLYSRNSVYGGWIPNCWNREHVWCQSLSYWGTETGPGSDIHHLRPATSSLNSTRNNNPYGIVATHDSSTAFDTTDCWLGNDSLSATVFEPANSIKGDIARILMYMYASYDTATNFTTYSHDGSLSISSIVSASSESAVWDMLVDWSESDPIDYSEIVRNNEAAKITGNRNAFVDHPEYGEAIWGTGYGLSLTTSNFTIATNGTKTLGAYIQGGGTLGSVAWSSSDTSVATVSSSGVVSGVGNGIAYITATSTYGGKTYSSRSVAIVGTGYQSSYITPGVRYRVTGASSADYSNATTQSSVSFDQTYSSLGQATGGNSFTLTVNSFNKTVSKVSLFMHSNQSSGNGTITITVGGSTWASGQFYGVSDRYTASYRYLDFTNDAAPIKTGTIVVSISCSTNSLYFEDALIDYAERTSSQQTDAQNWAQSFISGTAAECSNLNVTTSTWASFASSYSALSSDAKDYFYDHKADSGETDIYAASRRYLFIITKYTSYSHFIVNSTGDIYEAPYINSNLDDAERYNGNTLMSIAVISSIALFALMGGVIILTMKNKHREE
ncbi:MAG: endonuclease [Bacilli bacterium]|jgi:endonuclease I